MSAYTQKDEIHNLGRQISDIDLLDDDVEEISSDETSSIENYLDIVELNYENSALEILLESSQQSESIDPKLRNTEGIGKPRVKIDQPLDTRRHRAKDLRRRKTLDDFLCEDITENQTEAVAVNETTVAFNENQSPSDSEKSAANALEPELRNMLIMETQHFKDIAELLQAKTPITAILGRSSRTEIFEPMQEIHGIQGWIVSFLDNLCHHKSMTMENLITKLCQRQKILSKYAQAVNPRMRTYKAKLQGKTPSTSRQRHIELIQKPMTWILQTIENVKRIKEKTLPDDPNYDIISVSEMELLEASSDLDLFSPLKQVKEPIKLSLVVEVQNSQNSDRKLRSLFLFDNALVCARQRVIILRRHFTQDSDSDTASGSQCAKDQPSLKMNTKSISRYELKWFLPLDQVESLQTHGLAFDQDNLRQRLLKIESLKSKIMKSQEELHQETTKLDKESKRQKMRIPKIHRLRSYIYGLQAELVLEAPRLPLFIKSAGGQHHCFLMASEKERVTWKRAITQAKNCLNERKPSSAILAKRSTTLRAITGNLREGHRSSVATKGANDLDEQTEAESMKNELSYIINHCKSVTALNKLGNVIISGSALNGILEVCVHEITGLVDLAPYYVSVEVDSYGLFELVAKTKSINNTKDPCWNQTFMIELETSQTISFAVFRNSTVIAQLELPLEIDQINQANATFDLPTFDPVPTIITLKLSISFTEQQAFVRKKPANNLCIFGQPLVEVLRRDQDNLKVLRQLVDDNQKYKKTGIVREKTDDELRVPLLVCACAEEVERRGLQEEGIYRTCGTSTAISYLQSLMDQDFTLAIKQIGDYDINVISSLLKLFFRNLPESLIPDSYFIELVAASANNQEAEKCKEFSRILKQMPEVNLNTFKYLMDHLLRVCQYEAQNKMSIGNLSVIWAVTLIRAESCTSLSPDTSLEPSADIIGQSCAVQTATSISIWQTTIFRALFKAYAEGKLILTHT